MTLPYQHHIIKPDAAPAHGLDDYLTALPSAKAGAARAFISLAGKTDDLAAIQAQAARWQTEADHLVVIGAGGSGLSGKALAMLRPASEKIVHVLDSCDLDMIGQMINLLPMQRTAVLIVSKAGGTVETLALADILLERLRWTEGWQARAGVISMANNNELHQFAVQHKLAFFAHDADLPGRYAILSVVGLLPAAFAGIDITALRAGAVLALEQADTAAAAASWQYAAITGGQTIHVMMVYGSELLGLAHWWRQCLAESLGKDGRGVTPVIAVGTRDQHSQLQLYLDGANDKHFTLLTHAVAGRGVTVDNGALGGMPSNKRLGDIIDAQQRATCATLANHHKPLRHMYLQEIDEVSAGALLMQWMLEVSMLAELLGVNAYDQPAVEESKRLAREYLA